MVYWHNLIKRSYAIPHINKRKMDSGQKSGYYSAILSGKEDRAWSMELKYSEALCDLTASTRHAGKFIYFDEC